LTLTGHAADDPPQVRHASRIWRPIRRVLRAASQNAQFGNSDDKIRQANMLVWNQYHKRVLAGVGDIGRMSPDMVKGYLTLNKPRPSRLPLPYFHTPSRKRARRAP
jgi:hypothetical protein